MSLRKSRHLALKEQRIQRLRNLSPIQVKAAGAPLDDLVALEQAIHGQVVLPDDPMYGYARELANPAFNRFPRLVVYCETEADVAAALALARRNELAVACRTGGHSTAGFSALDGSMVIDTSRLRYAKIRDSGGALHDGPIVEAGAGCDFGYLGAVLDSAGLHVPGGGCEAVCVAGYMQGGGYSYTSRMYGMNCDNVLAVRVMLPDGRIVVANARQNYPLYWAVRGGTGNNFGVLLEVTYKLHRPAELNGFSIRWPIKHAARAILALQDGYMKTNPSQRIGHESHGTTINGEQFLLTRGMFLGSTQEARDALAPLLATEGAELQYCFPGTYFELNRYNEIDVQASVPAGAKEDKQCGYIRAPLSLAEWERVIDMFRRTPNPYSVFNLEGYGGAINAVPAGDSAFIHRDAYCDFFFDVFWTDDAERLQSVRYLDDVMALMAPFFARPDGRPQCYQNYPRITQTNYMELYFDGVIPDLVAAKRLYDPGNLFRFPQSIPLEYPGDARRMPGAPNFTGKEEIVVEG